MPAQAAAWLAEGWNGQGPLDLSRLLVIVPTRQAGRRLREALAELAGGRGQAVFPPRVLTPDTFAAPAAGVPVASRLESLLAWKEILVELELDAFRAVFPVDPAARNFPWAVRLAEELIRLQATLAEIGWRLADVAAAAEEQADGDFPEARRWKQLGEMESRYDKRLGLLGRRDVQAARIAAARHPPALDGIERLVLLATPDPLPLVLTALAAYAVVLPVEVAIYAPAAESEAFDGWGRPRDAAWERRPLALPDFSQQVRACADPASQADGIVDVARGYGAPDGLLAVGVADAEVRSTLASALVRADFVVFNPEGRARREEGIYHLLAALSALAREPAFSTVEDLARCPDFLDFLRSENGDDFSPARWLAGLDELRARHLPADLAAAEAHAGWLEKFPELALGLTAMNRLRTTLTAKGFVPGATAALRAIYARRRLDLTREADLRFEDAGAAWAAVVRECSEAAGELQLTDLWDLALRLLGAGRRADEKPPGALELQGWLEMLWEDAPHLAVVGLNDGRVPEAIVGDPFLPESLRVRLGIRTNAARFSRDAYVLQAIVASRTVAGRVDLFFGRISASGDPLRPSRLLLQCAETELPGRVEDLFRFPESDRTHLAWARAWQLAAPVVEPPERVGVTALRSWLACPFRFYLRHVLKMESVDPGKGELDDADFGTLTHAALEAMGREEGLRDCTDPGTLRDFLAAALERRARARFGENLTLPLVIQLESARQRLAKAAEVQARERAEGWRIDEVERKITVEIGGLQINGKIDRVDRHEESGALRVLDYKTSDRPVTPAEAHLRLWRTDDPEPEWIRFEFEGKTWAWVDLQLPLYRQALAVEHPEGVRCGYFNLPKAASETGLALWDDYSPELHAAALSCAAGVCRSIREGRFWPPNEKIRPERDEFATLFHHGAAASVAWRGGRE